MSTWNDMPKRWYEDYERGRPGYPAEAVDVVGLPSSTAVVDLGAGTGKLTRLLASRFDDVVAVEPDDEMRRLLVAHCPGVEPLLGSAEQIPLADASADALFAAECFHWFENERALMEMARVLRPRGVLVLMWNLPAGPTEPSLAAVEQLVYQHWPKGWDVPLDLNVPDRYVSGEWQEAQSVFGELHKVRLPNPQTVDAEALLAFVGSMGWIAALPDRVRVPLLDKVRSLLKATEYVLPWETLVHWTRPIPSDVGRRRSS